MCQNSYSWNICFKKKPEESAVETFRNISRVGVNCWHIKRCFWFWQQIFEKILFLKIVAGCFHLNSKFISKSSSRQVNKTFSKDTKVPYNTVLRFVLVRRPTQFPSLIFSCNQLLRLYASTSYKTKTIHKTGSRNNTLSIHIKIYL